MNKKNLDLDYYMNLPYTIIIRKDQEGGYFAKIDELEGCMTQGETYEEVTKNIKEAMELWLEDALDDGQNIPLPIPGEDYSGKFVLRLPKSLHQKLSQNAKKEDVSLNQYALYLLADHNARRHPS